jgi:acetylornithine deacetylase/succinyl-diaminopimelate desuccinylase-like protein
VFVAAADEEVGAGYGLSWLCEEHPDAVRVDYSLNEGAGDRVEIRGRPFWLCTVAEKMSSPFRLRVRGRSGHASMPAIADNALVKAARHVEALGSYRPPPRIEPELDAFFRAVTGEPPPSPEEVVPIARAISPALAATADALVGLTFSPTMIHASDKRNVVPSACEVTVDCRLLPEQTQGEAEAVVRSVLGDGDWELEWIEAQGGTRSPVESPLRDAIARWVAEVDPEAAVAPLCSTGFTDSHWLREAFGTVAYGFFPARAMSAETIARLIHSADERVPVADLELGVDFFRHAARTLLA